MFLMNTPPVAALPRRWEPFARAGRCRCPACLSEPEEGLAGASVSSHVQRILSNLQSEEADRHYGCVLQKRGKAVKLGGLKMRAEDRLPPQGPAQYVQHSCPVDSDGMEVEESPEFGPLSLNSDSDDSVDREIEEAIQEYLKNKGQRPPPLPEGARSLPSSNAGKCHRKEGASCGAACAVFSGSVETGVAPQPLAPGFLRDDALRWASSPCSVSSDDSFEQSIKAEIEQFLNEKKQQARKKTVSGARKSLHQKEVQEKVTRQKSRTSKASPCPLKRGGKAFFLRRHPELQNTSSPPKRWMPGTEELVGGGKTSQLRLNAPGAAHSCTLGQSDGDEIRQRLWKAGGGQGPESANVSDSSSDDGIEEAIQLYQLEKVRKAANAPAGCVPLQKKEFGAGGLADISASLTIHSEKSALPENPGTALNCKRKQSLSKPADLNRISALCNELGKGRHCSSPANDFASGAVTSQTCRADTAAELMCAEAILDISKTILLPPTAHDSRSLLTDPFFYSQCVPPSHQESDSNAVDSDDSIEQEIRAFLAIKAQTEHLITKSDEASNTATNFLSSGQLDDQIESPKQSFPNTLKLPLDQKRCLKEESSMSRQRLDEQMALLKTGCSHLDNGNHSKSIAFQKENVMSNVKNSAMGRAARQQEVTPAAVSLVDFVTPLSQGLLGTGGLLKNARQALQKYSIDDKSSSLDSDEDLDTAIKDLLRSKRKLKKKSKDQKIQCKKKVRFGNAEMHIFEDKLEVLQEKASNYKNPTLLKSCLMRSRRNIREEHTQKGSQCMVKGGLKSIETIEFALMSEKGCQLISAPDIQAAAVSNHPWIDTPLREDSSSLDSDDSIEQEIQRFLAEKTKDSSSTVDSAGALESFDTLKAAQPEGKHQQVEGEDAALAKRNKRAEKEWQPMAKWSSPLRTGGEGTEDVFRIGEQTVACVEDVHSQAIVKLKGKQGLVRAKGAGLSVKRMGVVRKGVSDGKLVQRSLPSWKEKAENGKVQNYFKPTSLFRRKNPREFTISSKLIAGFKSAQTKDKSVFLGGNQRTELSVSQSRVFKRQEGLLGERCKGAGWKWILGSKSKAEGADWKQRCMAEEFCPSAPGKMEVAPSSTGVASLAKAKPFSDEEPCSHAGSEQNSLPKERRVDDSKGANVSAVPSEIPGKEKEEVQDHSNSWEELSAPESGHSPLTESVVGPPR